MNTIYVECLRTVEYKRYNTTIDRIDSSVQSPTISSAASIHSPRPIVVQQSTIDSLRVLFWPPGPPPLRRLATYPINNVKMNFPRSLAALAEPHHSSDAMSCLVTRAVHLILGDPSSMCCNGPRLSRSSEAMLIPTNAHEYLELPSRTCESPVLAQALCRRRLLAICRGNSSTRRRRCWE